METKTTDFDTVREAIQPLHVYHFYGANEALSRIEASHSALFAALEAILADKKGCTGIGSDELDQAEAAIALAKGGSK